MNIANLWFTQHSLKRADQIPAMIQHVAEGYEFDELIELRRCEDGQTEINNGHHRVTAIWLSGRCHLHRGEYLLCEADCPKARFRQVKDFDFKIVAL